MRGTRRLGFEAINTPRVVLKGIRFISANLVGVSPDSEHKGAIPSPNQLPFNHEVGFYPNEQNLLDDLTSFVQTALQTENAAIVLATEAHRRELLQRLQTSGVSIDAMMRQGGYLSLDAAEALSRFMVHRVLDLVRSAEAFRDLIFKAAKAINRERPRVAIFGEYVHLLWSQGNVEAAIQLETIGNRLCMPPRQVLQ